MTTEPTNIMLEVEGVLEDVLAEVFRKRVCPMLEYCPTRPVRLVVTTQPQRFHAGQDGGDNYFTPGEPGHLPEFTWKASGVFQVVIHQFRFDFLGNLDARALESYVLFGVYKDQPAAAAPRVSQPPASHRAEPARPAPPSFSSVAIVPLEEINPPRPLQVVAEGGGERLAAARTQCVPQAAETPRPERLAQVIEAPVAHANSGRSCREWPASASALSEDVPEDVYQPLPEAEIASFVPGLEDSAPGPQPVAPEPEPEPEPESAIGDPQSASAAPETPEPQAPPVQDSAFQAAPQPSAAPESEPRLPEPEISNPEPEPEPEFAPRFRYSENSNYKPGVAEPEPPSQGDDEPPAEESLDTAASLEPWDDEDDPEAPMEHPAAGEDPASPGSEPPLLEEAGTPPASAPQPPAPDLPREPLKLRPAARNGEAAAAASGAGHDPGLPGNFYQDFFGFESMPFNNTPDTLFFMPTRRHQEALARLLYAVSERKGFTLITGEIGCGKSTLCRELVARLPREVKTALISHTHLSATQLLRAIAEDLGLDAYGLSRYDLLQLLNNFLIDQMAAGSTVCIIIDEAQNLDPDTLEEVRMISNLETEQEKLVQIVLVGQPEMRKKIALPELRQLRQRIAVSYHLQPLTRVETRQYICHRLKVAAPRERLDFKGGAMDEIHRFTGGVPRLINTLCDFALLTAFTRGRRKITRGIVREAARDLGIEPRYSRFTRFFQFW